MFFGDRTPFIREIKMSGTIHDDIAVFLQYTHGAADAGL